VLLVVSATESEVESAELLDEDELEESDVETEESVTVVESDVSVVVVV
jgi:hypothetical protein